MRMNNRKFTVLIAAGLVSVGLTIAYGGDYSEQPGMSSDQVSEVQKKLSEQGYNAGKPDGIMGKRTAQALRKFQKDHDQPVTGNLDNTTLSELGIQQAGMSDQASDEPSQQSGMVGDEQDSNQPPQQPGTMGDSQSGATSDGSGSSTGSSDSY